MSRLMFLSIAIVLSLLPVVAPAAPAHKRPAPRWHGYGFLPGYHQPPNNTLPAYAQKASVSRMARPWYIDPIPSYYGYDGDWHYFGRSGFYGGPTMAAPSGLAGRGGRSGRSGIAAD